LRLDDLAGRAQLAAQQELSAKSEALHRTAAALAARDPVNRVELEMANWVGLRQRMKRLVATSLEPQKKSLANLEHRLQETDVSRVLARGFVILSSTEGAPVMQRAQLRPREKVQARFKDGEAGLTAD
jgi:exonuclease VII large subunit